MSFGTHPVWHCLPGRIGTGDLDGFVAGLSVTLPSGVRPNLLPHTASAAPTIGRG